MCPYFSSGNQKPECINLSHRYFYFIERRESEMKKNFVILLMITSISLVLFHGNAFGQIGRGTPQFRAISGISMGGYGAMNIGLSHPDLFKTIAGLGGPLDMTYLFKYIDVDQLGSYDNFPSYPGRHTRLEMLQDLSISFGNPVFFNPASPYFPPGITDANARIPTVLFDFFDGGVNPDGRLPVITYQDPAPGDWVEVLLAVDLNGNMTRDIGEPVLRQFHEPFSDINGNGIFDPGEPFMDAGLDGVFGTADFGEMDGVFTYNPHRQNFLAEDPLIHLQNLPPEVLQGLNLYIDAGTLDEFQFNIHADNFARALQARGFDIAVLNGFPENFPSVSHFVQNRVLVKYVGGHVGFNEEDINLSIQGVLAGIQGGILIANRFATLFAFVSDRFPGGEFGTNPIELLLSPSSMDVVPFFSPSLNRFVNFGIYLPPGYDDSPTTFYPVLYFLGGYNTSISNLTGPGIQAALDALILSGDMQKMIIVTPENINFKNGRGHFFVNQIDQVRGDNFMDSFFDLVAHIDANFRTK